MSNNIEHAQPEHVAKPEKLEEIDWSGVMGIAEASIADADHPWSGLDRQNIEHYLFDAVIEAVYGKDVWPWINSRI